MQAFLCGGLVLLVALFTAGCQSSSNGGSLKAEQIVFDMECQISVLASEKEVACGMLKNSGTETVFTLTSPETAKGLSYQDINGTIKISLHDLSIDGAEALLPEYSWFLQMVSVLRYAQEQPQLLEGQGNGQFSGSTEQGTSFVITARSKGTIESITVDQYHIKCL